MRITVFTSNQPRHIALIEALAEAADEVYAVQECNTVFPGRVADFFRRSQTMQEYFARVHAAEEKVFGGARFLPAGVRSIALKLGDLNMLDPQALEPALQSDVYVVFGSSYIRGPLCAHLVAHRAYNIHMGVSPFYRGSSTNFWAMYDGRPQYVGATIHLLTEGLDSGPILCHALPRAEAADPFVIGMNAVRAGHEAMLELIRSGRHRTLDAAPQDRRQELRYTRNADFTDDVAREYLDRLPSADQMRVALQARDTAGFIRPRIL